MAMHLWQHGNLTSGPVWCTPNSHLYNKQQTMNTILGFCFGASIAIVLMTFTGSATHFHAAPSASTKPVGMTGWMASKSGPSITSSAAPSQRMPFTPGTRPLAFTTEGSAVPHAAHSPNAMPTSGFVTVLAISSLASIAAVFSWLLHSKGRPAVVASLMTLALALNGSQPQPAQAFPNAVPEAAQYKNVKKNPGKKPDGLGMLRRAELDGDLGLKPCGSRQTCFSSTPNNPNGDGHFLPPWTPPAGLSAEEGIAQIKEVVERYPPGQSGIDGGGFQIVQSEPGYLYAQFEALETGGIDDVEFGTEGPQIVIRSASRNGFIDQGTNSVRLNWIATELRKLGWDAPAITKYTHPLYFAANYEFILMQQEIAEARKQEVMFDGFRVRALTPEEKAQRANSRAQ